MVVFYENPDRSFGNVFDNLLPSKRKSIGFVVIPFTSGTGSEVTAVAVITFEKGDLDSRERVHNFQCMAGCAFGNTGLGMSHGISHSIGGKFNYGHGLLNAICLPYVLEYNRSKDKEVAERLCYLAKRLEVCDIVEAVKDLNRKLQIPTTFEQLGIKLDVFEKNYNQLLENALQGPTNMNPVKMNKEEMSKVLWSIYEGEKRF